jgi:ATP-dependent DNA helicase DinG
VRSHPVRVAIDLETTGLHPDQDAVIEIGALKFAGDDVLETFESFVATAVVLPYRVQRLTGITPAQLRDAPTLGELVPRLRAFLGDAPLVGHSVQFDAAFLRRVGLAKRNPLVDTFELASTLLPDLPSYTLAAVGTALGLASPAYHRALPDAQLSRDVFLALLARLEQLDSGALEALGRLAAPADWTPAYFIRAVLRARRAATSGSAGFATGTLGEQLAAKLGMDPAVLALAVAPGTTSRRLATAPSAAVPASPTVPSPEQIPSSALEAQRAIVASVGQCFAEGGALLVQAESDAASLQACLVPALRWAASHAGRVLVSSASLDGMSRTLRHVLPGAFAAAEVDPSTVPVAELAEQHAYLCLHRWFGAARDARNGQLPRDVARGLAKLTVWAATTQTGLRSEVALGGQELIAWERARGGAEFSDSLASCAYRRDGYCFVARASDEARGARLIVTTHAALAAQLTRGEEGLPEATRVLVLDAQLFEEELRRARSATLEQQDVLTQLALLAEVETGGQRAGLFHLAAQRSGKGQPQQREQGWFAQVQRTRRAVEVYFEAARKVMTEAQSERAERARGGEPLEQRTLRVDDETRQLSSWPGFARAWEALRDQLSATAQVARETAVAISGAKGGKAALASDGVATDLVATARVLEQRCEEGAAFMRGGEAAQMVRWLRLPYASGAGQQANMSRGRAPGQPRAQPPNESAAATATPPAARTGAASELAEENTEIPVLHSAPIAIGSSLAPLLGLGSALVLAGPALAVAGDFTYTRGALGLPESVSTLEPAIDRADQTLLCLPTDVPEPNAQQYQRHLDDALVGLAAALGGRLVAIFPSHAALRASAHGIRRALERHDILVLAQGQDGSARQLWHTFRTEPRVVLLGAGSFWEGAEQIEQPPACVVVTRIPFPALSDPLLAALADSWPDPQSQFVVPHAALRVRQALGGLAWSHNRRNAVVLFDRRAQTRGYSSTLLGTLPHCTQYQETMAQITERAVEWVG